MPIPIFFPPARGHGPAPASRRRRNPYPRFSLASARTPSHATMPCLIWEYRRPRARRRIFTAIRGFVTAVTCPPHGFLVQHVVRTAVIICEGPHRRHRLASRRANELQSGLGGYFAISCSTAPIPIISYPLLILSHHSFRPPARAQLEKPSSNQTSMNSILSPPPRSSRSSASMNQYPRTGRPTAPPSDPTRACASPVLRNLSLCLRPLEPARVSASLYVPRSQHRLFPLSEFNHD
ncbi:hypothetical protein EVG20_g10945 [Dentipellis fragilis]|uniref:Uncharacterized protein n=1 Tax=Dentipellis fragilis TaxID=205917 RepID=A0A4Y9XPA7_9AGAM|nr:hypothetical protein EVG20_g10945 [Dentipellis fragilis]